MAAETPIVLVHGGGFDHRCWDRLVPLFDGPVLAVDLPGRGRHPAPFDTVDLPPLAGPMPRVWVRTVGDRILAPDKQLRFAANVGDCPVVDMAAGHMCMVSQPEALAGILRKAMA